MKTFHAKLIERSGEWDKRIVRGAGGGPVGDGLVLFERVKAAEPDGIVAEEEQDDVAGVAGAEAAANGEMDFLGKGAFAPLLL